MMDTRLETRQIEHFLAVAETGSFRKAAASLNIGQSAVSRRIQRLEELLGVSLFERRPNGARLTQAGACFASRSRAILDDVDAAMENARTAATGGNGNLRIGLIASVSKGAMREVLQAFLTDHPSVDVTFVATNRSELLTHLSRRRIDAFYAAGEPTEELGDGVILTRERVFLAVPADGVLAEEHRLSWNDVLDERFVVPAREPGPEIHDYIIRRVSGLGHAADVRRHRLGREGIMTIVGLGLGVSLVADHWRGVSYPNVVFIPVGDDEETVPFTLTWRPDNDNPALRRFISLARIEAKRNGALS
ncbi:LysR substrate-binding domain-containing protein [uncultured Roseobacter sp.]|uniref:LysR family transcriptional regulator n=1 Tax=uncultured Roseobacter sp. TaxID=114847 RepID=UPI00262B9AF5|nr:LysR substrate-binding domain-containing protein [uncultured Roseobacter sp.]